MQATIVNDREKWAVPHLQDPLPYGYIHIGASVTPPPQPGPPFAGPSARRSALFARLKEVVPDLEQVAGVRRVTLYEAILVPPAQADERTRDVPDARFDVAVLIELDTPDAIPGVQGSSAYRGLVDAIQAAADHLHVMTARNIRLLGDVDKTRSGVFLFNHFTTERPEVATELWEHLAGWYAAETGLDNSTLLQPLAPDDFVFVNHARWDQSLARLTAQQFAKPSFRNFVLANLRGNCTVATPVLYRLA